MRHPYGTRCVGIYVRVSTEEQAFHIQEHVHVFTAMERYLYA